MAPESNNWLSFSLSSMEMMNSAPSMKVSTNFDGSASTDDSHNNYYSFADNFYATGWPNQKAHAMYSETENFNTYMQPPPKLEDFFAGGESTETQDSSLTHIYDHHATGNYFEQQDLKNINGFQAFSANSGSEVDDSGFVGQTQSPVESGAEFVSYSTQCLPMANTAVVSTNCLSLGVQVHDSGNMGSNNNDVNKSAIVPVETESCKKIADTFGQRTSIYRGVTRHRWTGRYEAHLWDNSCRREGQARKGRQVYLGGYDKEDKAARAYDLAALKYWGTSATTNFPIANYSKEVEEMKHVTKQEFIASLRRKSSGFSRGASIYRGVTRHHQQGRWQARIGRVAGNKDLYLGTFATEEEAAEAYDIAAIKFRGINAVTNFEMNRYDVEAISKSPLPIGGAAKRLKNSLENEQKLLTGPTIQTPCSGSSISFASVQPSTIPCGVPFDNSSQYYQHNFFQHLNPSNQVGPDTSSSVSSMVAPVNLMQSPTGAEFFIWNHQSY